MQPDTVIPDLSNPQTWNRYSYVNNNPILYNDPDGHFAVAALALPLINFGAIGAALAPALPVIALVVVAVAIGVVVGLAVSKYIDHTSINRANTTQQKINDTNNGKKTPGCRGVSGKVYCGIAITTIVAAVVNMFLGDGSIGEDESLAQPLNWTPIPSQIPNSTLTPSMTPTATSTPTMSPTSTPTYTPTNTPTNTPTYTPTNIPATMPSPRIIPKPSYQFSAIPI